MIWTHILIFIYKYTKGIFVDKMFSKEHHPYGTSHLFLTLKFVKPLLSLVSRAVWQQIMNQDTNKSLKTLFAIIFFVMPCIYLFIFLLVLFSLFDGPGYNTSGPEFCLVAGLSTFLNIVYTLYSALCMVTFSGIVCSHF